MSTCYEMKDMKNMKDIKKKPVAYEYAFTESGHRVRFLPNNLGKVDKLKEK